MKNISLLIFLYLIIGRVKDIISGNVSNFKNIVDCNENHDWKTVLESCHRFSNNRVLARCLINATKNVFALNLFDITSSVYTDYDDVLAIANQAEGVTGIPQADLPKNAIDTGCKTKNVTPEIYIGFVQHFDATSGIKKPDFGYAIPKRLMKEAYKNFVKSRKINRSRSKKGRLQKSSPFANTTDNCFTDYNWISIMSRALNSTVYKDNYARGIYTELKKTYKTNSIASGLVFSLEPYRSILLMMY
uniref:Uncharacterized protein n=1 Tax=Acrobeloides nanus TaxID=290746 RepID=A0A914CTI5_9BILA